MEKTAERKLLNKKGFSMVEIIIVIAIMAVLVAVLAPTYIKYVERSRISTDETNADELQKACKVMLTDSEYYDDIDANFTVAWADTGITVTSADADTVTAVKGALTEILEVSFPATGAAEFDIKSKQYGTQTYTVSVYVTAVAAVDDDPAIPAGTVSAAWAANS